jgi:rfaE bifunctional protein nucleotidyltransferase chain/domain/rfaE bifunctional protein kinase chain/domain
VTDIVVVGDAMLDRALDGRAERISPEGPVPVIDEPAETALPGGAALAAALAAADGVEVTLVTAIGRDPAGIELSDLLADVGVTTVNVGLRDGGATHEKLRVRGDGKLVARLDRGDPVPRALCRTAVEAIRGAGCVLVEDYGRGIAADPALAEALASAGQVVWDPHPRGPEPPPGLALVTPNALEARALCGLEPRAAARELLRRWRAGAVTVTCGSRGVVLAATGSPAVTIPAAAVTGADACGAGDRFATSAALALGRGATPAEAVAAAVESAAAFVALGGVAGGRLPALAAPAAADALALADEVRRRGGTVVATGGCFDLLHAGHAAMLAAARALGDCLVVCLNSDASVARLKGPDRPIVAAEDRAALLRALTAVDAVLVFEEDTPTEALSRLRPHVWVKGADYAIEELPEARVLAGWGGEVVLVPYVPDRSTTLLLEKAVGRAA